jgi:hypothetical protein
MTQLLDAVRRRASAGRSLPVALIGAGVVFRIAIALAALADHGHRLAPGFPVYHYDPRTGDAYGYYSAVRELLETWRREGKIVLPAALLLAAGFVLVWRLSRRSPLRTSIRILAGSWAVGLLATVLVHEIRYTGAGTIGWPLVWSVPLLPYRALGLPLNPSIAFGVGLTLSLVFVVATVIATYLLGRSLTGSTSLGVAASLLFAFWPLLVLLLAGSRGTMNGTWQIDVGLSQYTEPISTALACVALVLVLRKDAGSRAAAVAGALFGFDVAVRLSNLVLLGCALAWLLLRDRGRALWVAVTAAAFAPVVLAFYRQGYFNPSSNGTGGSGVIPAHVFALRNARVAWTHSLLWRPPQLVVLVPLAVVGAVVTWRSGAALLSAAILTTAAFYTVYFFTPLHPRFLFVVLPLVLVLWVAGVWAIVGAIRVRFLRPAAGHA